MKEEIIKDYEQIRKKYGLPEFDGINSEFEISAIEDTDFLLRGIKNKIIEKLEFLTGILHPILQPDTNSFTDLHECRAFSDEDKKQVFAIYGRLMTLYRNSLELSLVNDDRQIAEFINDIYKKLPELRQSSVLYIKKMRETWEKEFPAEEDLGYLG